MSSNLTLSASNGVFDKPFEHAIACIHFCLPGADPKYGDDSDFEEARAALQRIDQDADLL